MQRTLEPELLREDFFNSLLAAGLDMLQLAVVSDRHWLVSGQLPA